MSIIEAAGYLVLTTLTFKGRLLKVDCDFKKNLVFLKISNVCRLTNELGQLGYKISF